MGFKHRRIYYGSEVEKPPAQPVVGSVSGEPTFLTTTGQQRIVGGQQRATTEGTAEDRRDRTTGNRTSVIVTQSGTAKRATILLNRLGLIQ